MYITDSYTSHVLCTRTVVHGFCLALKNTQGAPQWPRVEAFLQVVKSNGLVTHDYAWQLHLYPRVGEPPQVANARHCKDTQWGPSWTWCRGGQRWSSLHRWPKYKQFNRLARQYIYVCVCGPPLGAMQPQIGVMPAADRLKGMVKITESKEPSAHNLVPPSKDAGALLQDDRKGETSKSE